MYICTRTHVHAHTKETYKYKNEFARSAEMIIGTNLLSIHNFCLPRRIQINELIKLINKKNKYMNKNHTAGLPVILYLCFSFTVSYRVSVETLVFINVLYSGKCAVKTCKCKLHCQYNLCIFKYVLLFYSSTMLHIVCCIVQLCIVVYYYFFTYAFYLCIFYTK